MACIHRRKGDSITICDAAMRQCQRSVRSLVRSGRLVRKEGRREGRGKWDFEHANSAKADIEPTTAALPVSLPPSRARFLDFTPERNLNEKRNLQPTHRRLFYAGKGNIPGPIQSKIRLGIFASRSYYCQPLVFFSRYFKVGRGGSWNLSPTPKLSLFYSAVARGSEWVAINSQLEVDGLLSLSEALRAEGRRGEGEEKPRSGAE